MMSDLAPDEVTALDDLRDHERVGWIARALLEEADTGG